MTRSRWAHPERSRTVRSTRPPGSSQFPLRQGCPRTRPGALQRVVPRCDRKPGPAPTRPRRTPTKPAREGRTADARVFQPPQPTNGARRPTAPPSRLTPIQPRRAWLQVALDLCAHSLQLSSGLRRPLGPFAPSGVRARSFPAPPARMSPLRPFVAPSLMRVAGAARCRAPLLFPTLQAFPRGP